VETICRRTYFKIHWLIMNLVSISNKERQSERERKESLNQLCLKEYATPRKRCLFASDINISRHERYEYAADVQP
jgi:hypothetical protein